MDEKVSVFISYAHEDEGTRKALRSHLESAGMFDIWDDRLIPAGGEWDDHISVSLGAADIILLLVSAEFVTSKYVTQYEIPNALQLHDAGRAKVVPVLVRSVIWENSGINHLQALPADGKWLMDEPARLDSALTGVVRELIKVADEIRAERGRRQAIHDEYRREVARHLSDNKGISDVEQRMLDDERDRLGLTAQEAEEIAAGEVQQFDEIRENQGRYADMLAELLVKYGEIDDDNRADLRKFQEYLALKDEHLDGIEERVVAEWQARPQQPSAPAESALPDPAPAPPPASSPPPASATSSEPGAPPHESSSSDGPDLPDPALQWSFALHDVLAEYVTNIDGALVLGSRADGEIVDAVSAWCGIADDPIIAILHDDPGVEADEIVERCLVFGVDGLYVCDEILEPDGPYLVPYDRFPEMSFDSTDGQVVEFGDFAFECDVDPLFGFAPGTIVVDLLLNVAALVEVVHDRLGGISELVGTPTAAAALADLDDLLATRSSEMEEFEDRVYSDILAIVERHEAALGVSLFVGDDIAGKKLSNAVFGYGMPLTETPVALIDCTVFGSAKNGMLLGLSGFCFHSSGGDPGPHALAYTELATTPFAVSGDYEVTVGDVRFSCAGGPAPEAIVDLLGSIEELFDF